MNVLIIHSWQDKTTAEILARDIGPICGRVWLDTHQLNPEEHLQHSTNQTIHHMDRILLLWSQHAAKSQNARSEIDASLRNGKRIILCRFDNTPIPPLLHNSQQIDFLDYRRGFGRLSVLLLQAACAEQGLTVDPELSARMDLAASLDDILAYHHQHTSSDPERGKQNTSIIDSALQMHDRVMQLQNELSGNDDFIQTIYSRLDNAGAEREEIQSILNDVILREYQDPELLSRIRAMIERHLGTLAKVDIRPQTRQNIEMEYEPAPEIFQQTLSQAEQEKKEIRQGLQPIVDDSILYDVADIVHYYIATSQDVLGLLHDIVANSESQSSIAVVQDLYQYLKKPNDLFPESQYGAWGLIDDAWLIHNSAYRLIEAGLIAVELFPFEWDKIAAADHVVIRCLPPPVIYQLEVQLMQFLITIASEVEGYQPQFSYGQTNYHPHMGQAQAVGGRDRRLDMQVNNIPETAY